MQQHCVPPRQPSQANHLDAFAALLLADAEDDYDHLIALTVADLVITYRQSQESRPGRQCGHPGALHLRAMWRVL